MNTLQNYSSLIAVVKQMEADLGLSDLSEAERLVIAAIGILQEKLGASNLFRRKRSFSKSYALICLRQLFTMHLVNCCGEKQSRCL